MNMIPLAIVTGAGAALGQSVLQDFELGEFADVGRGCVASTRHVGDSMASPNW